MRVRALLDLGRRTPRGQGLGNLGTRYSFTRGFNGSIYTLTPLVSIQVLCYGKYIFNSWPSAHSVEDGALHMTTLRVESVRVGDSCIVCACTSVNAHPALVNNKQFKGGR